MKSNHMSLNNWILLFLLSIVWGGSFFFQKVALMELPVFTIVFLRLLIASIILLIFAVLRGKKLPKDRKVWFNFIIMGVVNNAIPFSLIVTAQTYIDSSFASILNASTPFITIIVAHIFTKDEVISFNKIVGVITGLTGVVVLIGLKSTFLGHNAIVGALCMLTAATCYASAGVWGKRFKKMGIDPVVSSTGQLLSAAAALLPVSFIIERPWNLGIPSINTILALTGMAFLSTAVAYIIYFHILSFAGATNVLLVTLLVPVSAIMLSVLLLGEEFYIQYVLGMIIIALGLSIIDGRLWQRSKKLHNVLDEGIRDVKEGRVKPVDEFLDDMKNSL